MLTATLRGVLGPAGVVVGPFKHASAASIIFQLSSGTSVAPPWVCHHSKPASHERNSMFVPTAFRTFKVALVSSGPVPSPLIKATLFVKTHPSATSGLDS